MSASDEPLASHSEAATEAAWHERLYISSVDRAIPDAVRWARRKEAFMHKLWASGALVLFLIVSPAQGDPSPKPKITPGVSPRPKKESTVRATRRPSERYAGFGNFFLKLDTDGSVKDVLVLRSTGNKPFDAWMTRGLSHNQFKQEQLTEEEWATKRLVVTIPFTMETFKASKHIANPRILVKRQLGPRR